MNDEVKNKSYLCLNYLASTYQQNPHLGQFLNIAIIYIDDMLISLASPDEHLKHLELVF